MFGGKNLKINKKKLFGRVRKRDIGNLDIESVGKEYKWMKLTSWQRSNKIIRICYDSFNSFRNVHVIKVGYVN